MSLLVYLVTGTLALATTVWFLLRRQDQKYRKAFAMRNVKYVQFSNPLISVMKKERTEDLIHEMIDKEGKVFGFSQFFFTQVVIAVPELVQLVMSKEFTNFADRRTMDINDKVFKNALSTVNGDQWKRLRSIITPAFSTGKLRQMKPCIDSTLQTLLANIEQSIQQNNIMEVKQLYSAFTMDSIVQSAFGIKVDSFVDKDNPLVVRAKKLFAKDMSMAEFAKLIFLFMLPKLGKLLGLKASTSESEYFNDIVIEIVGKKRKELASNTKHKSNNFIELLLEAEKEMDENETKEKDGADNNDTKSTKKGDKYITNDELVAQSVLFFLAGFETTASTITFASYLLALNPEIQDRLYSDIVSTLKRLASQQTEGDNSKDTIDDPFSLITFESLSKFEYLTAVVNETLRLYAPAPLTERAAANDIVLQTEDGSHKIDVKKGDLVAIPIYSLHHDVDQFPEPDQFRPERFMDESTRTFHKYAYIPFGSGPRNCVARSFALIEVKNAILHTIFRYKLSICEQTTVPVELYYQSSFVTPKNVFLKFEKRV